MSSPNGQKRNPSSASYWGFFSFFGWASKASCLCHFHLAIWQDSGKLFPPQWKSKKIWAFPNEQPPFCCQIGRDNELIISPGLWLRQYLRESCGVIFGVNFFFVFSLSWFVSEMKSAKLWSIGMDKQDWINKQEVVLLNKTSAELEEANAAQAKRLVIVLGTSTDFLFGLTDIKTPYPRSDAFRNVLE